VRQLLNVVRKVAATDAVVLLRGESGTGKELLARAVTRQSARRQAVCQGSLCRLSAICSKASCSAMSRCVHRRSQGQGRPIRAGQRGTLFLDEIGDISLEVQTKLLRVLQEKTFERVGSSEPMSVDVRIITATHQNLEELIRQGRFREDLFYRLNVFPIQVPSLRERREDVPELAVFFIEQSSQRCKKKVQQIDDDALAC